MEKLLIINPGSTSTKIAIYDGETPVFVENINHPRETIAGYDHLVDQYEFRRDLILDAMKAKGIVPNQLTAIVARGGMLPPIEAGAYEINDDMVWQLCNNPVSEHASNLGAIIAGCIAKEAGIPAYIYDGVTVDEMIPVAKITGLPGMWRRGMGHNLNMRAAAMRYAREQNKAYNDCSVVVVHMGGGISVGLHHGGKIIDIVNDEEGPFSPERAGGLPSQQLIKMATSGEYSSTQLLRMVKSQGGLFAYFGTTDCRAVEDMALAGDARAQLIMEAMVLSTAKFVCAETALVCGKIEAILLTGGIAHSRYIADMLRQRVEFLAPVIVYPGENEMESLALGGLRVVWGLERAKIFHKSEAGV